VEFVRFISECLAPGTYQPEKTKLDSVPQFTFGLRTPLDKPSDTPGNTRKKEPRFQVHLSWIKEISSRTNFFFSKLDVPAPGTYSPEKVNLEKGPQYSLTGKGRVEKCNGTPGIHMDSCDRFKKLQ